MENHTDKLSTLEIINGGVEVIVHKIDGTEEKIKVRQLPLRQMSAYGLAQGDEARLCEMFADKDAAWVDALTTDSQVQIVEIGDQLNMGFFLRWAERRMAANNKLQPLLPALASAKSASPSSTAASTLPKS